ncbi:MAG: hypothetical protein PHC51_12690 [bacterium]|nr:hypothetical protein [bacterium]
MLIPNLSAAFFAVACLVRGLQKMHDTAELGSTPGQQSRKEISTAVTENLHEALVQGENLVFFGLLLLGVPFLLGIFVDKGPISELAVSFGHLTFAALLTSGVTWLMIGIRQDFVFGRYIRRNLIHETYCDTGHHYWLFAAKKTGSSTWRRGLIQLLGALFFASYLQGFMPLSPYSAIQVLIIALSSAICAMAISTRVNRSIERVFPSTEYTKCN